MFLIWDWNVHCVHNLSWLQCVHPVFECYKYTHNISNFTWISAKHNAIPNRFDDKQTQIHKKKQYFISAEQQKNWITISTVPKHIYSFIEFGKEEMSFHFESERKKVSLTLQKWKYPHFFSLVANEQYAMSRKKEKKCIDWKYAELINFPFISSTS